AAMARAVDAAREPARDRETVPAQVAGELLGRLASARRRIAAADDRELRRREQRRPCALDEERERRMRQRREERGIFRGAVDDERAPRLLEPALGALGQRCVRRAELASGFL